MLRQNSQSMQTATVKLSNHCYENNLCLTFFPYLTIDNLVLEKGENFSACAALANLVENRD